MHLHLQQLAPSNHKNAGLCLTFYITIYLSQHSLKEAICQWRALEIHLNDCEGTLLFWEEYKKKGSWTSKWSPSTMTMRGRHYIKLSTLWIKFWRSSIITNKNVSHWKIKMLQLFTQPQCIPNMWDILSSVKHKKKQKTMQVNKDKKKKHHKSNPGSLQKHTVTL